MHGRSFSSFDEFRSAFWKEVAKDPILAKEFSAKNLVEMQKGNAPFTASSQSLGKARRYNLHHITPIQHGGGVYNMDNLQIVTPRFHKEVLDPLYHY